MYQTLRSVFQKTKNGNCNDAILADFYFSNLIFSCHSIVLFLYNYMNLLLLFCFPLTFSLYNDVNINNGDLPIIIYLFMGSFCPSWEYQDFPRS